jgi:hypothetical protein
MPLQYYFKKSELDFIKVLSIANEMYKTVKTFINNNFEQVFNEF